MSLRRLSCLAPPLLSFPTTSTHVAVLRPCEASTGFRLVSALQMVIDKACAGAVGGPVWMLSETVMIVSLPSRDVF